MALIVQKYGGTSVGDLDRIRHVAGRITSYRDQGHDVVVVVSAMSGETNRLVALGQEMTNGALDAEEMDVLTASGEQVSVALMAMAIHSLGYDGVSLTGGQIGIRTDSSHTRARIQSISTARVRRLLDDDKIVIAAGFQGIDEDYDITTLGRGGSDTTPADRRTGAGTSSSSSPAAPAGRPAPTRTSGR